MRTPAVISLVDLGTNDTLSIEADGLGLHTFHGQCASIVEGLRIIGHFYILSNLLEPLAKALMCHVIDTVADNHAHRSITGLEQRPEILAGEVRSEGHAMRIAEVLAAARTNG